jgi:hypothetical protein
MNHEYYSLLLLLLSRGTLTKINIGYKSLCILGTSHLILYKSNIYTFSHDPSISFRSASARFYFWKVTVVPHVFHARPAFCAWYRTVSCQFM